MALISPLRGDDGAGPPIPGGSFLNALFVVPERWGEGIGGALLDAVLTDARRRRCTRIHLWAAEDNSRAHSLYTTRGFSRTGRVADEGGEWAREL